MLSTGRALRRPALALVALACSALALAGPGLAAGQSKGAGEPFVLNIAQAPATLDPGSACGLVEIGVLGNLYMTLTQYGHRPGPDGTTQVNPARMEPYAAKSWKISKDRLTYTFKLRPGMKFPSGKPVDSSAVKWSWERLLTMNGCGAYFVLDGIYTPLIKSMETPDPLTFIVHLSQPDANVLQNWAQPATAIVDQSVVDAHGGVEKGKISEYMSSHAAGNGPFLLDSYIPNKQAVLVANPDYPLKRPASSKIIINFINSDPTLLLQARSGKADVTLLLSKQSINSLKGNGCCRIVANNSTVAELIGLANDHPPFDNVKFRTALTYAVPYQQILDNVAFGYGVLYFGPWIPAFPWFNPKIGKVRAFDLNKAKALIKASGVSTPVNVEMVIPEGNSVEEQIATVVQGVWRDVGVNLTIRKLSATDYINALEQHKVQSFVRLDGPGVIAPDYFWDYDGKCKVGFNLVAMCIPAADKLVGKLRGTSNPAKRKQITDAVARMWVANSPRIPVYADQFAAVLSKAVKTYYYSHELDFRTWAK